jgi:2-hydroxychromene-2-carboxylate isomerase
MKKITWYYDFISPYAYLQCHQLSLFTDKANIECKPILFAGLLNHWGQLGPAEIVPKRLWTFEQVAFLAHRHNIPLQMPPMHPFNPIPLLRLAVALDETGRATIANIQRLFGFVWQERHLPTDTGPFTELLREFNLTMSDISTPGVKETLKANGEQALAAQVFGVPTSVVDGKVFWGFDSAEMLLTYLNQDTFWESEAIAQARAMPQGLQRPRS